MKGSMLVAGALLVAGYFAVSVDGHRHERRQLIGLENRRELSDTGSGGCTEWSDNITAGGVT